MLPQGEWPIDVELERGEKRRREKRRESLERNREEFRERKESN